VGGLAELDGQTVMILGHERGGTPEAQAVRRRGMPGPEGYRKALRLMRLAAKFQIPVITLIDTPGADSSYEAERRGIAQALARNLAAMAVLPTPIVSVIIGEGGSGGALALGVADRVLMQEHAIYSVISPRGARRPSCSGTWGRPRSCRRPSSSPPTTCAASASSTL